MAAWTFQAMNGWSSAARRRAPAEKAFRRRDRPGPEDLGALLEVHHLHLEPLSRDRKTPVVGLLHRVEGRDVEGLVERGDRAVRAGRQHVGVPLAPGGVGDLGHHGPEPLAALVEAVVEAHRVEDVAQRSHVEVGGYRLAWVGFTEQDEKKTVRPVAYAGSEKGYLEKLNITWADTERGRGPTGTAIRSGMPNVARHILTDPNFKPWRAEALKRGYASLSLSP